MLHDSPTWTVLMLPISWGVICDWDQATSHCFYYICILMYEKQLECINSAVHLCLFTCLRENICTMLWNKMTDLHMPPCPIYCIWCRVTYRTSFLQSLHAFPITYLEVHSEFPNDKLIIQFHSCDLTETIVYKTLCYSLIGWFCSMLRPPISTVSALQAHINAHSVPVDLVFCDSVSSRSQSSMHNSISTNN